MEFTFKSVADLHELLALILNTAESAWPRRQTLYSLRAENARTVFLDVQKDGIPVAQCDLSEYVAEANGDEKGWGWFDLKRLVELLSFLRNEPTVRFAPRGSDLSIITPRNQATFRRMECTPIAYWPEPGTTVRLNVNANAFITFTRFVRVLGDDVKIKLIGGDDGKTVHAYGYSHAMLVYHVIPGESAGSIDLPAGSALAIGKLTKLSNEISLRQSEIGNICLVDIQNHRFFMPTIVVHDSVVGMARNYIAQADHLPACSCDAAAFGAGVASLEGNGMLSLNVSNDTLTLERSDDICYARVTVPCETGVTPSSRMTVDYNVLRKFAQVFGAITPEISLKFGPHFLVLQSAVGTATAIMAAMKP